MRTHLIKGSLVLVLFFTPALHAYTFAQDSASEGNEGQTTASEQSENVQRLEEEKKEEELKAAIAKAKKEQAESEAAEADAGASEVKGLEGTVTLNEGAGYFSEILAYRSLREAGDKIANLFTDNALCGEGIVITTQSNFPVQRALWLVTKKQIESMRGRFEVLGQRFKNPAEVSPVPTTSAVIETIGVVSAGLSALAEVAKFFKEDIELTKFETSLNDEALVAAVASQIDETCKAKPSFDGVFLPGLVIESKGELLQGLETLAELNYILKNRLAEILETHKDTMERHKKLQDKRKELESELADLIKKNASNNDIASKKKQIEKVKTDIEDIQETDKYKYVKAADVEIGEANKAYEKFVTGLVTPPKEGAPAPIELLSGIDALMVHTNKNFLYLKVSGQGGEVHVSKSVWTGGRVSYIGGSTSVFLLSNADGRVMKSGFESLYRKGWYGNRGGVKGLHTDVRPPR